jgi:hypothetical protein
MPTASSKDQITYGPDLLTKIIKKNNLIDFVKEESVFHPIRYSHSSDFINPMLYEKTKSLIANSVALSLFNSSWLRHGLRVPKINSIPKENTLIGYLTKKYIPKRLNQNKEKRNNER